MKILKELFGNNYFYKFYCFKNMKIFNKYLAFLIIFSPLLINAQIKEKIKQKIWIDESPITVSTAPYGGIELSYRRREVVWGVQGCQWTLSNLSAFNIRVAFTKVYMTNGKTVEKRASIDIKAGEKLVGDRWFSTDYELWDDLWRPDDLGKNGDIKSATIKNLCVIDLDRKKKQEDERIDNYYSYIFKTTDSNLTKQKIIEDKIISDYKKEIEKKAEEERKLAEKKKEEEQKLAEKKKEEERKNEEKKKEDVKKNSSQGDYPDISGTWHRISCPGTENCTSEVLIIRQVVGQLTATSSLTNCQNFSGPPTSETVELSGVFTSTSEFILENSYYGAGKYSLNNSGDILKKYNGCIYQK